MRRHWSILLIATLMILFTLHSALAVPGEVLAQFPNGTAANDFTPNTFITYNGQQIVIGTADANAREVNVTSGVNWNGKVINATIIINDVGTAMSTGQNFFWGVGADESVGPNGWDVWWGIGCGNAQYGSWQTAGLGCGSAEVARVTGNVTLQVWMDTTQTTNNVKYYFNGVLERTASVDFTGDDIDVTGFYHGNSIGANWFAYNYTICEQYCGTPAPAVPIITASLSNLVNGSSFGSVTFSNVTGSLTFNYHNITGAGFCVSYTGNGTGTNCTAGAGASTYFNVTNTTTITGTQAVSASTYQGLLDMSAYRLFLETSINSFNATNNQATNTTTSGSLTLPALNGSNNVKIDVAGNYSKNITCTLSAALSTVACNATGIHDNYYSFNATDVWNNIPINNFGITINNNTLGGNIYAQNTTNGTINASLIQGYTYTVFFSVPNATYEYLNTTLPANASYHRYNFRPLPAPSIDITIRDAEDNSLILENVTIELINNITGQTNYTTTGGFFSNAIDIGTYTIKLESTNYTQSTYTVTVNTGSVYFLTAYLQYAPNTVIMQYVDSISSSVVLPNTAVSQERIVNGNWQVISSKVTDITGRTSFRYADDVAYRFTATKTGYADKTFTLDPILFDSYSINLQRDTALDFSQDYQSIYIGYNPKTFYNDQNNNLNITINSPLGTLTSYNYTINYPGGTQSGSGTNSVGQTFNHNFTITGATVTSNLNITLTYDTGTGSPKTYTYQHNIITASGNNTFIKNTENTYGLGLLERLIIGTIILVLISGLITLGAGSLWGLGIGLLVMGVWINIGFWPWWAAGISFLVGFAIIAGRTD